MRLLDLRARLDARALNVLLTAVIDGGLGLMVLTSDPLRFSAAAFAALADDPGGLTSWAVALVVAAALLAVAPLIGPTTARFALLGVATLLVFIGAGFVEAWRNDGAASPWGWWLIGSLAARHIAQALYFLRPTLARLARLA